jgi:hypothetical protein
MATTQARVTVGVLRAIAGAVMLVAIVVQIADRIAADALVPGEYFSYFTVQSGMMNVVVLLSGAVLAFRHTHDTVLYTGVRMATLVYAVVTAVVYNALLRGLPPEGYAGLAWPIEVEHVWIPLYLVIDWLFATGRARLTWAWIWAAVSYPLVWCAFTLVRGGLTGWYPYPFIDPTGAGGWPSVIAYIIGLSAFIVLLAAAAIWYSRWSLRQRDE